MDGHNLSEELGLTSEQTRILFSCQQGIVLCDIAGETNTQKRKQKQLWAKERKASCETLLKKSKTKPFELLERPDDLESELKKVSSDLEVRTPLFLILMEVVFFTPYHKLDDKKDNPYKSLKISSKQAVNDMLAAYADVLGVDRDYIERFKRSRKKSIKSISGYWTKVLVYGAAGAVVIAITGGLAAPAIGAMFAGAGLSGAAAISAGLAALGGGAIAAGGFGMAGGIAVIVGGGAILGLGAGCSTGMLFSGSSQFALSEATKLEVVMKEIILFAQKDIRLAQEIIKKQREATEKLQEDLFELRRSESNNKKAIKNLTKSLKYLRKAVERNENSILLKEKVA